MGKLDDSDLKAIKKLIEETVDEVIEKRELATKKDLDKLPTKEQFYEAVGRLQER